MPAVLKKIMDEYKNFYDDDRKKAKDAATKIYDEQEIIANNAYNQAIKDAKISYEDQHRENAIQKLINENEIAEDMANMGHSDSGLNRTQQTAVQLSYANNRAGIERQKQVQLDTFAQNLAAELSSIRQNKISDIAAIDKEYDSLVDSSTQAAYKVYQEEETKRIEEQNNKLRYVIGNNNAPLSRGNFTGTLRDAGVTVTYNHEYDQDGKIKIDSNGNKLIGTTTYYDKNSGKKTTVPSTVNPYTMDNNAVATAQNKDLVAAGESFGYFDNGYQPKGINGNTKFKLYSQSEEQKFIFDYASRNVFEGINTKSGKSTGKFYTWDEENNMYLEIKKAYTNKATGEFRWEVVK